MTVRESAFPKTTVRPLHPFLRFLFTIFDFGVAIEALRTVILLRNKASKRWFYPKRDTYVERSGLLLVSRRDVKSRFLVSFKGDQEEMPQFVVVKVFFKVYTKR